MIPALKVAIAHYGGDPAWTTVRPPLSLLTPEQASTLIGKLDAKGFAMPGQPARRRTARPTSAFLREQLVRVLGALERERPAHDRANPPLTALYL